MTTTFFNTSTLITCFFLLTGPAAAQPADTQQPLAIKGIYRFDIAGFPIGQMGIEVNQTLAHYAITSDIMTTGLVKVFVKHSSHTTVSGTGLEAAYESRYQTKGKKKYVKMVTHDGVTGGEVLVPPDNPTARPPVPTSIKKNVADPLTIILRMRDELWKAEKNHTDHFSLMLYDGRRLTQVNFAVGSKKTMHYGGKDVPVILVSLSRKFIAGFTKTELSDRDPNEPPARLYFTDDARLLPIRAEFNMLFGTASATLVRECTGTESCLLGIKE